MSHIDAVQTGAITVLIALVAGVLLTLAAGVVGVIVCERRARAAARETEEESNEAALSAHAAARSERR